ncbi:hypothetical protein HY523_01790 [Candidatus Berkelbacteria bacterium]|nr:hypothetical protein [Candidatus Berkelbacteria bacterium]
MAQFGIKELTKKVDQLERLVRLHIEQEQEKDWLDEPKLVKKLDAIATNEESVAASTVGF